MYDYQDTLLEMQHCGADVLPLSELLAYGQQSDNVLSTPKLYLYQALEIMQKSHTADLLIHHCIKSDIGLYLDSLLSAEQSVYHESSNVLDISEQSKTFNLNMHNVRLGQMVIALVSGLRQAWHYNKGNGFHPELSVRDLLHLCRSAEADTVVFVTLICWELREKGNSYAWRQWLTGENADVARAFEETQAEHGSTKNMHGLNKALQESYRQWFRHDDRGTISEHMALEKLDRVLMKCKSEAQDISWIGKNTLTTRRWSKLGEIPGCNNYLQQKKLLKHGFRKQPVDVFNRMHFQHVLDDISE